jgi:hypothetical protein
MLFILQLCGLLVIALLIGVVLEKYVTIIATWLNNKKYIKLSRKGKDHERSTSKRYSN